MYLYHYYEKEIGPFRNLSNMSLSNAQTVLNKIKESNETMASHRYNGYLERRAELENIARKIFISKGGKPLRTVPQYMVIEECKWLETWYKQSDYVKIHISEFDTKTISFCYGDMFPTFSPQVNDEKEYRKQVYTYEEILKIIEKYGFPQDWNKDGQYGPERYIEVHVWSDYPIQKYYTCE